MNNNQKITYRIEIGDNLQLVLLIALMIALVIGGFIVDCSCKSSKANPDSATAELSISIAPSSTNK